MVTPAIFFILICSCSADPLLDFTLGVNATIEDDIDILKSEAFKISTNILSSFTNLFASGKFDECLRFFDPQVHKILHDDGKNIKISGHAGFKDFFLTQSARGVRAPYFTVTSAKLDKKGALTAEGKLIVKKKDGNESGTFSYTFIRNGSNYLIKKGHAAVTTD